ANRLATVDLPDAIPPVRPMSFISASLIVPRTPKARLRMKPGLRSAGDRSAKRARRRTCVSGSVALELRLQRGERLVVSERTARGGLRVRTGRRRRAFRDGLLGLLGGSGIAHLLLVRLPALLSGGVLLLPLLALGLEALFPLLGLGVEALGVL